MTTNNQPATRSFTAAMKDAFGFAPGQGLKDFGDELKSLSPADRAYFSDLLNKEGFPHTPPNTTGTAVTVVPAKPEAVAA